MLDILGAMTLTSIAALFVGALTLAGARDGVGRIRIALAATAWFLAIATLAASGVFSAPTTLGTTAIGAAVVTPIVAGLIAFARARSVRAFALGVPLAVLVAAHVGRLFGGFFVALHAAGRLPPTFALTAGWGDVLVAATAPPLAWAIHRRVRGWRSLALAWNAIAILDLVVAVSLGVGSAANSPVRVIFESPDTSALGALPWLMIPGFMVPLYILTHLAIFAQIAGGPVTEDRSRLRSAA